MSVRRAARAVLLLVAVLAPVLATACQSSTHPCTPESSGFGAQKQVTTRRELPGVDRKESCQPRVIVIRNDADLRRAYTEVGVKLVDPSAVDQPPDAIALPAVDWSVESVVLREATHVQSVSWIVVEGQTVTLGTQGCVGGGDLLCGVTMLAIPAIVTVGAAHACEDIGCGGGPSGGE